MRQCSLVVDVHTCQVLTFTYSASWNCTFVEQRLARSRTGLSSFLSKLARSTHPGSDGLWIIWLLRLHNGSLSGYEMLERRNQTSGSECIRPRSQDERFCYGVERLQQSTHRSWRWLVGKRLRGRATHCRRRVHVHNALVTFTRGSRMHAAPRRFSPVFYTVPERCTYRSDLPRD